MLVDWVFGDSSVFLAWVVLGAALLGLLLGLLLAVLLQATRSWWLVVAIIAVLVAAAAAWFVLLQQEEAVTPVASPSPWPSLSPSPLPSFSPSPSPYASPQPSLAPSPLPSLPPLPSPGARRLDGILGTYRRGRRRPRCRRRGDGAYEVTFYDGALQVGASVPATQSTDELQLEFIVPSQFSISGPSGPFAATLTLGDDPDTAVLRVTAVDQTTTLIPFRRVPE